MQADLMSLAINGPTIAGGQSGAPLPIFSWDDPRFASQIHDGQPESFNFQFVKMAPQTQQQQQTATQ